MDTLAQCVEADDPFCLEVEEEAPTDWIMQAKDDDFDASSENWNSHIYAFSRQ